MADYCTTVLCKDGRAKVAAMFHTLNYLTANAPGFIASAYAPPASNIQASLDAVDSWYADLIPFNPTCCTIDDIGRRADALTNQMLSSVGATSVDVPPPPVETDWTKVVLLGGVIFVLVAYAPQIKAALKK